MNDIKTEKTFFEFWREGRKFVLPFIIFLILIFMGELASSGFSKIGHVLMLIKVAAFLGMLGLAQMIVIVSGNGGIDLSVGAVSSIGAVIGASILGGNDSNIILCFFLIALMGLMIGLVNGLMISYFEIPPLVMTLAMSSVVSGTIIIFGRGILLPGSASPLLKTLSNGTTFGVPNIIFLWLGVTLASLFIFHYTKTGMKLYGVGANENAAILKGADVKLFRFWVYGVSGAISAVTGLFLLGYIGTPFLDIGHRYVLPSVAAVTIGGISIRGGVGNYLGVVGGALVLSVLAAILVSLEMGEAGRQVVFGIVLLILLTIYSREKKEGGKAFPPFALFKGRLQKGGRFHERLPNRDNPR